jgi:hypothetical protein
MGILLKAIYTDSMNPYENPSAVHHSNIKTKTKMYMEKQNPTKAKAILSKVAGYKINRKIINISVH